MGRIVARWVLVAGGRSPHDPEPQGYLLLPQLGKEAFHPHERVAKGAKFVATMLHDVIGAAAVVSLGAREGWAAASRSVIGTAGRTLTDGQTDGAAGRNAAALTVDALLGLLDERLFEDFPVEVFGDAVNLRAGSGAARLSRDASLEV